MEHGSFLQSAFIYLLAAVLAVPVAKRLGLGSVLGYLAAGMLIGPFGLALVGDAEDVMHFAEFGVVMMLFLVGLELRPAKLWRLRVPILGLGGAQVGLTTVAIMVAAMGLGQGWQPALIIGMVLSLSSTAIVLQTLSERGLLRAPGGRSAFSVLLFQDIAVIPMLALIPVLAPVGHSVHGNGGHGSALWVQSLPAWGHVLVVFGTVGALVGLGAVLVRPAFRIIVKTGLRELFTAFSLLLLIGIALLMQLVGLSPALGTFLAGVVMAESEYRHELETNIEPFKGLLLGLFFISVGASIDFALLAREPGLIVALVAGLVAVKLAVLLLLSRFTRMATGDGLLFTFAMAQGSEFAFVLFAFTRQVEALPQGLADMLVAVVALSMLSAPLLMLAYTYGVVPRLRRPTAGAADTVEAEGPVIIAGFGRFGQIVGRLLRANNFPITVLDHSAEQVELLRRFGERVFFGDASRPDLLEAAGAAEARLLVVAVDDPDSARTIVEVARQRWPHLDILVRAYDRRDAYALMPHNVTHISLETFGSALETGVMALRSLGFRAYQAERAGQLFRSHEEAARAELAAQWGNDAGYRQTLRQRKDALAAVMRQDRAHTARHRDVAWDATGVLHDSRTTCARHDQCMVENDSIDGTT